MKGQHLAMDKDIKASANRSRKILKTMKKNKKETEMKTPKITPQVKGALKTVAVIVTVTILVATGWILNDQFDNYVTAKASEMSKTNQ